MNIRTYLQPGDIGTIIQLHGILYAQEYGLDHTFEGYVASGMGEFAASYDQENDYRWTNVWVDSDCASARSGCET